MKATMKDVFYHALLARAGYMLAENKKDGVTLEDVPKLLMESKQSKMTQAMADYLVSKFDFIKVADDDDVGVDLEMPTIPIYPATPTLQPKINGYNGMIFQSKTDKNHYVLVNRGTEFDIDSLERFVSTLTDLWSDGNLAIEGDNEQSDSMKEFLEKAKKDGLIPEGATITTTGHSLGGFLSSMAIKDEEMGISWAYGYNGAGYRPDANLLGKATKALESIDEVKEIYEYYKDNTGKDLPKLEQFFDDPRLGKAAKLLSRFKILVSAGYVGFNNLFDALGWKPLSMEGNMTNVITEEGPDIVAGTGVKIGETRKITVDLPIDQTSGIASLNEHSIVPLTDAFVYAYLLDAIGNDSSLESFNRVVKAFSLMPGDKLTGLFEYLAKSFEYGSDLNKTLKDLKGGEKDKESAVEDIQTFLFKQIKDFEDTPSSNIRIYHLFNSDSNILIDNAFDKTDNGKLMRHALLNHSAISFNLKSTYGDKSKLSKILGNDSYSYDKFVVNDKEYDRTSEYEFFKNLVAMSQMVYENNMMEKHGEISHEGGMFPYPYEDSGNRLYVNHWRETENLQNPYVMFENVNTQIAYEKNGKNLNSYANGKYNVTFVGSHFDDNLTFISNGDDKLYGLGGTDTLNGGGGTDYLNGGEHDDYLFGGSGSDILWGGSNDDVLYGYDKNKELSDEFKYDIDTYNGGKGNDKFYGSRAKDVMIDLEGYDIYHTSIKDVNNATLTADEIYDRDGKGHIVIDGKKLKLGEKIDDNSWYSKDKKYKIVKYSVAVDEYLNTKLPAIDGLDLSKYYKTENGKYHLNIRDVETGDLVYKVWYWNDGELGLKENDDDDDGDDENPPRPPFSPPNNPPTLSDPLILDLNHNGQIDTVHLSRGVNFDLDGNRFAEQTSWVSGDDGFVVLDTNNNGRIDNGSELFGTDTLIQGTTQKAKDGFGALAQYDNNKDGIINHEDDVFHRLKIWQDKNQDGISQEQELKSLEEHGIVDISLSKRSDNTTDNNQVTHTYQGSFTQRINSSSEATPTDTHTTKQGVAKTLLFQVNTAKTKWQPHQDDLGIPDDIKVLPDLMGYGSVKSLHQVMADDTTGTLKQLVMQFAHTGFDEQHQLAEQILIHWTGQQNTAQGTPIEGRINLQQLATLKALWGKEQEWENVGLHRFALGSVEQDYYNTLNSLHSQLLMQTHHQSWMNLVEFKVNHHEYQGVRTQVYQANFRLLVEALMEYHAQNPAEGKALISALNFTIKHLDINHSQIYNDWMQHLTHAIKSRHMNDMMDVFTKEMATLTQFANQNGFITGTEGSDTIYAKDGNDVVDGLTGHDTLMGDMGHDIIIGGAGDDYLEGGAGSDTYVFKLGDGVDRIYNHDANKEKLDTIYFAHGIQPEQVRLKRSEQNLIIQYSQEDHVTISYFFDHHGATNHRIDQIQFADADVVWKIEDILQKVLEGSSDQDSLYGYDDQNNHLAGKEGNDTLMGGNGDDILIGGGGDDQLNGGDGHDTYVFALGDGVDTIDDAYSQNKRGVDTIEFAENITPADVETTREADDLVLQYSDSDKVVIRHFFNEEGLAENAVRRVTFANGTTWTPQDIKDKVTQGTAKNDMIYGYNGSDDVLQGQAGNDTLYGKTGNDILHGGQDDDQLYGEEGNDIMYGDEGRDRLDGGQGDDTLHGGSGNDQLYGGQNDDHLYGEEGNDTLHGDEGNDILHGHDGNDSLSGGDDDDTLHGGSGNDQLYGSLGNDVYVLDENWGSDIIFDTQGFNTIHFKNVNPDSLTVYQNQSGLYIKQIGTNNLLEVYGYLSGDNERSATGNIQTIHFDDGTHWDSTIILQKMLIGSIENDALNGFNNDDHVWGGLGNDVINGHDGNDLLEGNDGEDTLYGGGGDDTLHGGQGKDYLYGGQGNDTIYGDEGDDIFSDTLGLNTLIGGAGYDTYRIHGAIGTVIDDKEGVIHLDGHLTYIPWGVLPSNSLFKQYSLSGGYYIQLANEGEYLHTTNSVGHYKLTNNHYRLGEFIYHANDKTLTYKLYNWQNSTSPYNHIQDASALDYFTIRNFDMNDANALDKMDIDISTIHLNLNVANQVHYGTKFSLRDFISQGHFKAQYSDGNDVIYSIQGEGFGSEVIHALHGNDTIYIKNGHTKRVINDRGHSLGDRSHRTTVHGGDGDDTITSTSINHNITLYGDDGNDVIESVLGRVYGGLGHDNIRLGYGQIEGGDGNDHIHIFKGVALGEEGDDIIIATNDEPSMSHQPTNNFYARDAQLIGGAGNDTLIGNDGNNTLEGGAGADTLIGGLGDDIYIADRFDTYLEEVAGLEGGYDTIHIDSDFDLSANNFEAVTLLGDGNFNVTGDEFDNIITGNAGNNHLTGGLGDDTINGGDGDDHLDGGIGIDTLTGGFGNDYYILDDELDTITEQFGEGVDTVEQHTDRPFYTYDESSNLVKTGSYHQLFANVENLILKGHAKTAFGNDLDNAITLNTQNNFVNALSGNDTIIYQKGGGKDTIASTDSINSKDTLVIEGYDLSEASFMRVRNTASAHDMLQIHFKGNANDVITLIDYFAPTTQAESFGDIINQDNRIDEIVFNKHGQTTTLTQAEFEARIISQANNRAPQVNKHPKTIHAQAGKALQVQFDQDTIKDPDAYDDKLDYSITLTTKNGDGQYNTIPSWLHFDANTLTLTGTPPQTEVGHLTFILWGKDTFNHSAGTYVTLNITQANTGTTNSTAVTPTPTPKPAPTIPYLVASNPKATNNTYLYTGGQYILKDTGGQDILRFASNIKANQVTRHLIKQGDDLILKVNNQDSNTLTITNYFNAQGRIEQMRFGDGVTVGHQQIYNAFGVRSTMLSSRSADTHHASTAQAVDTLIQAMSTTSSSLDTSSALSAFGGSNYGNWSDHINRSGGWWGM